MQNQENKTFIGTSRRSLFLAGVAMSAAACAPQSSKTMTAKRGEITGKKVEAEHLAMFTLNIEMWWRQLPLLERVDAAARSGFQTAEMWGIGREDEHRMPRTLLRHSQEAGIKIIHCTVDVPNLASSSERDVKAAMSASLEQLNRLGVKYGTIVGHNDVKGMTRSDMLSAYLGNLHIMAPMFEEAGIVGLVEPFNPYNHPGHFVYGSHDAVEMCRQVNSPALKINWDLFHMQRAEGNVVHALRTGIDQCAYIQIADSPDRREPGTGEMTYDYILNEAKISGFKGPMGLECAPIQGQEDDAVHAVAQLGASLINT